MNDYNSNKETDKTLIPKLRFPEFQNSGEWKIILLEKLIFKTTKRNTEKKYSLVQSISNKHGFINQDEYFDNRQIASKDTSKYYVVDKGTFAYNPSRIDVGSLAYKNDDNISIVSPLYVCFKCNQKIINDYFLLYWFNTNLFKEQMITNIEGGVRNTLNFENLIRISIPIPSLPEQQKIADCLSSLDEVITAERQMLELLKAHKKGLLQNLFPREGETMPKLRFPEFQDSREWEEKRLEEIADFHKGKGISKADVVDNGKIPCIRYGELYTHYGEVIKEIKSFTNLSAEDLMLSEPNDVIIPSSGETKEDIATASCVKLGGVGLGGDLNILRSSINGEFLAYYLCYGMKKAISKIAQGDTVVHLYATQLKKLIIRVPLNKNEQQKIASCLSSLDDVIQAQQQKIELLEQHKKGLLQGLFPNVNDGDNGYIQK